MDKLPYEINTIKIFASWNGFPKSVVNSIISKILNAPFIAEDFQIKLPCIIVLLIMTIKVFHQLNPTFTKSNQIAEKRISYTIRSRCTLFLRPENRKPWGVHKEQMN